MTDDEGCDYCYGTMQLCPVCGPFEYAPDTVIGGHKTQGYHVDGWDLSGRMPDWHDSANADGWCWRDTEKFFATLYDNEHVKTMGELLMRPSGLAIGLRNE